MEKQQQQQLQQLLEEQWVRQLVGGGKANHDKVV